MGLEQEGIETAISESKKRREETIQEEKINPIARFVPSGENFHFESVPRPIQFR